MRAPRINAIPLGNVQQAVDWGKRLVNYRADVTVTAIKKAIASSSTQ